MTDSSPKKDIASDSSSLSYTPCQNNLHIIDQLSSSDLFRYESFRRSGFSKPNIKKLVNLTLRQNCNPNFIIAISGIAKVFVGELVKKALEIQKREKRNGSLMPSQIHKAYAELYKTMPNMKKWNRDFFGGL